MPRKRPPDPDERAVELGRARWKCVIRNPAFRRELRHLGERIDAEEPGAGRMLSDFLERWAFSHIFPEWIVDFALSEGDDEVGFLKALQSEVSYWPAWAHEIDRGNRFVTMTVDVSAPLADLVLAFEREIRDYADSWSTTPRGRRRLDKLDFQLNVHDRFMATRSFSLVAKELKKPVTTIRSAFWSALRAIGESVPERTQRAFVLHSVGDPVQHKQQCATCKTGETLCRAMWAWVNQDTAPQRELTVGLTPSGKRSPRNAKGRAAPQD